MRATSSHTSGKSSRLPKTARSASMLRGGWRSSNSPRRSPEALRGVRSTVATGVDPSGTWVPGTQPTARGNPRRQLSTTATLFHLDLHLWHDPPLELAVDFARQTELHRVQAQLLERSFELEVVGRERNLVVLEGRRDFGRAHAAIQMAVLRGVGFDRHALLGNLIGQPPQFG